MDGCSIFLRRTISSKRKIVETSRNTMLGEFLLAGEFGPAINLATYSDFSNFNSFSICLLKEIFERRRTRSGRVYEDDDGAKTRERCQRLSFLQPKNFRTNSKMVEVYGMGRFRVNERFLVESSSLQ